MNIQFGAGRLFAFTSTGSPVQFGALQEASLDFSPSTKELFGSYQFPLAVARGTAKVTGKAKFANIDGAALASLHFNETPAAGQEIIADNEAGTVPSQSTYTIQVEHHSTKVNDYGVIYAETGLPFKKVDTPANAGEYSEASGTYTFDSADAGAKVKISYSYTTAGGHTITLNNQLLGLAPVFQVVLQQNFEGKIWTCTLYQCVSAKLAFQTKLEDYNIPDFEWGSFCNAANELGKMSFPE